MEINEEIANLQGLSGNYSNLGIVYGFMDNYEQALHFSEKCLDIQEQLGDSLGLPSTYNNLAIQNAKLGHDSLALQYYNRSIELAQKVDKRRTLALAYANRADVLIKLNDLEQAIESSEMAMEIFQGMNDPSGFAHSQVQLADLEVQLGRPRAGLDNAQKAYEWATKSNEKNTLKAATQTLSDIHFKLGNYKIAYQFLAEHKAISDTLLNAESIRNSTAQIYEFEYAQEQEAERMRQEKVLAVQEAETESERLWKYFFIGGSVILIAFIGLVFWSYHNLRKTNSIISRQKEEIVFLNQNLEKLVADRTTELEERNKKLSEYIFTNSHKVRGPIARILGILEVRKATPNSEDMKPDQLFSYIEMAATEADRVVNEIGEALEDNSQKIEE